jgi:hypothetical protein
MFLSIEIPPLSAPMAIFFAPEASVPSSYPLGLMDEKC